MTAHQTTPATLAASGTLAGADSRNNALDRAQQHRPRRSVLYVPGSNPRAIEKTAALDADVVILDLEDAVAPEAKAQARTNVVQTIAQGRIRQECAVRINGLDTPWGMDDIAALAGAGDCAILLSKVEHADTLRQAADALGRHAPGHGHRLWAMLETPRAFLAAERIAGGHPLLECLVIGTSDLVKDLHARHTPERTEVLFALSVAVMAARAFGLDVIDGVHLDLHDLEGLRASARQARTLGFDGKSLIHPRQIAIANAVFGPSEEELQQARDWLQAWERRGDQGVIVVDGKLVERLHIEQARRILALAGQAERNAP